MSRLARMQPDFALGNIRDDLTGETFSLVMLGRVCRTILDRGIFMCKLLFFVADGSYERSIDDVCLIKTISFRY